MTRSHVVTAAEVQYLLSLGNSAAETAQILGISTARVYALLAANNMPLPGRRDYVERVENRGTGRAFVTDIRRLWLAKKLPYSWAKRGEDHDPRLLESLELPDLCPALGIRLIYGRRGTHDNAASLDRQDPSKGYVFGNVSVISLRANRIKQDATAAEIAAVAAYAAAKERSFP